MAALDRMRQVQDKFRNASDLMQGSKQSHDEYVGIKHAERQGRSTSFGSYSGKRAASVQASNQSNHDVRMMRMQAQADQRQLDATHEQTELLGQQSKLAGQQATTMKQVRDTMDEILRLLTKDANKQTPKYTEFAKAGATDPYFGTPEGEGIFDSLGGIFDDLLGGGDFFGRGRDRGGRGGRTRSRTRTGSRSPGRLRNAGAGAMERLRRSMGSMRNMRMPRVNGRAGLIAALLAGGAYGANELYDWLSGSEDDSDSDSLTPQMQAMNGGAMSAGSANSYLPWQHYSSDALAPFTGRASNGSWYSSGAGQSSTYSAPAGQENNYGYNPTFTGSVPYTGLGSISASEESGTAGVHTVSTGRGDHGGVSYGTHQLASRNGSMAKFLASEDGSKYAEAFRGLTPGSAAFTSRYREVARNDAEGFEKAQAAYIARTHYQPILAKTSQAVGQDLSQRGKAVQEMLYSTGVQYGPSSSIVSTALRGKDVASMTDAQLISTVQDYKRDTVGTYFRSSSPAVQRSVANRAGREKAKLLALNTQELQAKANGQDERRDTALAEASSVTASQVAQASSPSTPANQASSVLASAPQTPASPASPTSVQDTKDEIASMTQPGDLIMGVRKPPSVPTAAPTAPATAPAPAPASTGSGVASTAARGATRGAVRGAARAVPFAMPVIAATDAVRIYNDETMTTQQKERAGAELAGGVAGGLAGAKAGAATGAGAGAAIGAFFGGVGAAPGAAIGGFLGGVGGGIVGYMGGSKAGGAVYDAVAGSPEEGMAKEAANSNKPVAGVPSVPLVLRRDTQPVRLSEVASTGGSVDIAALMKSDAQRVEETSQRLQEATSALVAATETQNKPSSPVTSTMNNPTPATLAAQATQTGSGLMGSLISSMGIPAEWAGEITAKYEAMQSRTAGSSSHPSTSSILPTPRPPTEATRSSVLPSANSPVITTAPVSTQTASNTSPASQDFYSGDSVSTQASTTPNLVTSSIAASAPASSVANAGSYAAPVERTPHDPVQSVMMLEPKRQDTMMPERFKPAGDRISTKGLSEGNSVHSTLEDCPVILSGDGLVLLQVGYL